MNKFIHSITVNLLINLLLGVVQHSLCWPSVFAFLIMSGCLDKISCECWDAEEFKEWLNKQRNMFASVISGTLVGYD